MIFAVLAATAPTVGLICARAIRMGDIVVESTSRSLQSTGAPLRSDLARYTVDSPSPGGVMRKLILLSLAMFIVLSPRVRAAEPARRPNIIFILVDDLGYGDVGAFFQNLRREKASPAEPWHMTPHLDSFAAQGMQLRDNYTAAPVCAPSRSSLLTGVTQGHAMVRNNQFDDELARNYTLGSTMQRLGYATAAFGKWGLQGPPGAKPNDDAHLWPAHPLKRGFDYYYGYMRHVDGHWHYPHEDDRQVWENYKNVSADLKLCYTTDLFAARAKKWIIDQTHDHAEQPFFIYLAFDTPHAKLQNPPCAFPEGGGLHGGLQWLGEAGHMINTAAGQVDGYMHPDYADATWDDDHDPATPARPWPDVYRRYANDVRRIDDAVGDLMRLLVDLHIDDNTLVIFTSDNGPSIESYLSGKDKNGYPYGYTPEFFHSYGPFDGIKRDCWEGGVRMPTMARWPGRITAGAIDHTPCGSWDWLMTFADAGGQVGPARSDGVSLLPTLTGRGKQTPSSIYIEYENNAKTPKFDDFVPAHRGRMRGQMQVVRFDDMLGVRYNIKAADDDFEIYNVVKDPQEKTNLASEPGMSDLQKRMKAAAVSQRMPRDNARRPYDDTPVPAVELRQSMLGVKWNAFAGDWPWLPKFEALTPTATGQSPAPDLSAIDLTKTPGVMFSGYLTVPTTGRYKFTLTTDSPSFLRLHDCAVIDNDFSFEAGKSADGSIVLEKGAHPFRLYYAHKGDAKPMLHLEWTGPDGKTLSIPDGVFVSMGEQ
ncbi:MAG: sulfatase-like hydrolase/transferase [Planctomycetes bacterium]|nr:sulfatase-like hydrolase/transferase [Planctomycetota bacterium]